MGEDLISRKTGRIVTRAVAFQIAFVVGHFAYDWWPSPVTAVFSGVDESVFQHMKIGFYAWIAVSAGELVALRPAPLVGFLASRLLGAVFAPLIFTTLWYLAPAIFGPLESDLAEILWANATVLAAGLFIQGLEDRLGERRLGRPLEIAAFAFALVALFLFARFTAAPPWVDLFAPPVRP